MKSSLIAFLVNICYSPQDIEAFREEMERRQLAEGSPSKLQEVKDEDTATSSESSQIKSCS